MNDILYDFSDLWCPLGGQFGTLLRHNSTTFSERDSGCDFRTAVVLPGLPWSSRWRPDDGQARVRVLSDPDS